MSNVRKEAIYLYVTQISNMFLPLLLIPYLTSVLGVDYFGKLSYSQVISMLATFFVDFGFNFSAAKEVSINLENRKKLGRLFVNVQSAKIAIYILVCIVGGLCFLIIPQQKIDNQLLLIGVFSSVSSVLTPGWFLQGIGRNSLMAFANLFSRVVSITMVFFLVKGKDNLIMASFLQLFAPSLAGIIVLFILKRNKFISFRGSSLSFLDCKRLISESFHNFSASCITLGFTYFNPLLIKYFIGDAALGVYSLADKLVNVLRQLYSPMIQANFSGFCDLFNNGLKSKIRKKTIMISLFFLILSVVSFFLNYLLGDVIIPLFFAKSYSAIDIVKVVNLISIMIVTQFVISLSMVVVNLIIIPSNNSRYLKVIYAIGLFLYFLIIYPMANVFSIYGVALSITLVELSIVIMFFVFVKNKKII